MHGREVIFRKKGRFSFVLSVYFVALNKKMRYNDNVLVARRVSARPNSLTFVKRKGEIHIFFTTGILRELDRRLYEEE